MPGRIYAELIELANERHGFVTPADAKGAGIHPMNLVRMAERGQLERRANGIYRFPLVPRTSLDAYMEAALWPRGGGILSHQTALDLYEMSDVHPTKIDITIPKNHRVQRQIPRSYRLHREGLEPGQVGGFEGIPLVTPAHAVRQAHRAHLGAALLAQAIDQGQRNGRLSLREAKKLRTEVGVLPGDGSRR